MASRSGHLGVEAATAAAAAPGAEDVDEVAQLGLLTLVDLLHGLSGEGLVSRWRIGPENNSRLARHSSTNSSTPICSLVKSARTSLFRRQTEVSLFTVVTASHSAAPYRRRISSAWY